MYANPDYVIRAKSKTWKYSFNFESEELFGCEFFIWHDIFYLILSLNIYVEMKKGGGNLRSGNRSSTFSLTFMEMNALKLRDPLTFSTSRLQGSSWLFHIIIKKYMCAE